LRFVALIPARLASSRLPNKPLALIAGVPMVVHVARRALQSGAERVVVAADSPLILEACQSFGVQAVLTRNDHACGSDRLAEASRLLALPDEAVVVNVQGDEPLIDPALIDACAAALQHQPGAAMATAAHPLTDVADLRNPNVVKVVLDQQGFAMAFSRAPIPWWRDGATQGVAELPPHALPALRHIGIYAYTAGFLRHYAQLPACAWETVEALEQLRVLWHGHRMVVHCTAQAPQAGVDTPADLARVRGLLEPASAPT